MPESKKMVIKAKGLSYNYPDGTLGLNGISFNIFEGDRVAFIGPNGSGKSTLMTFLNGVRRGDGELEIFGFTMNNKNHKEIKKIVGLVFQNPDDQLFCSTIYEDVAFGPLNFGISVKDIPKIVKQALLDVGLSGYEKRSSFHISYGERKLASIATVIAMNPRIIAMDEPTSNLDLSHRRKIINWINNHTHTFVLTTHDLDMALETCSYIYILNRGEIVEEGTAENILYNKSVLEKYDLELPLSVNPVFIQYK